MKNRILPILIQCLYAGACAFMGIIFISIQHFAEPLNWGIVLPTLTGVSITIADYGSRWYRFTTGDAPKGSFPFLFPCLSAAVIFTASAYTTQISSILSTLTVCLMFAALFTLLNVLLAKHDKRCFPAADTLPYFSRRYTIIMPLVFVVVQSALLGCCLTLTVHGIWQAVFLYAVVLIYAVIWLGLLQVSKNTATHCNLMLLAATVIASGIYFLGYYYLDHSMYIAYQDPIKPMMKAFCLSVFCGGVISVPGITELAQVQRGVASRGRDYQDRDWVLSLMTGAATFAVYITWTWIDFSFVYLVAYATGSLAWVCTVKFLRGEQYKSSLRSPFVCLLFTVGFLITEFLNWWTPFKLGSLNIKFPSAGLSALLTILVQVLAVIIKPVFDGSPVGARKFIKACQGIRVYGLHMASLCMTAIVLFVMSKLGGNPDRISVAACIAFLEGLAQFAVWFLAELSKRKSQM